MKVRAHAATSTAVASQKFSNKKAPTTPKTPASTGDIRSSVSGLSTGDSRSYGVSSQNGSDGNVESSDLTMRVRAELAAIGQQLEHIGNRQVSIATSQLSLQTMLEKMHDAAPDRPTATSCENTGLIQATMADMAASGLARNSDAFCSAVEDSKKQDEPPRAPSLNPSGSRLVEQANYRRQKRLQHLFEVNNRVHAESEAQQQLKEEKKAQPLVQKIRTMDKRELETYLDSFMCGVIMCNAIFIGLSLDHEREMEGTNPWEIVDTGFLVIFFCELVAKCYFHGFREMFCTGRDRWANLFDSMLVFLDSLQVALGMFMAGTKESLDQSGLPAPSLFRVVRLVRLTRLIRLLRYDIFADLLAMLQGLYGGGLTLFWAVVVFGLITYVTALVCRDLFGNTYHEHISIYFNSVPRSMYTVFRCSFGDCSSKDGYPIPEFIVNEYGGFFGVAYCCLIFFTTVGLFNVISAIFVDSTMQANTDLAARKNQERLANDELWATAISTIISEMLAQTKTRISRSNWLKHMDELVKMEFLREDFEDIVITDPAVQSALNDLDIDWHEHRRLPDILDPDHSGTINVLELVNGLGRLRGQPRRSDVVSVELMVRNLQEVSDGLFDMVSSMKVVQEATYSKVGQMMLSKRDPTANLENTEVFI